jgi:hypothetical protein
MLVWPWGWGRPARSWPVRLGVDLSEGPGPVATQTLVFWSAVGGPSAKARRPGDGYPVAAGDGRLIWAGLAGHGG